MTQIPTAPAIVNHRHWRNARRLAQLASFLFFLLLALLTYRGAEALIPLDLYFRLDPLVAFGAMLAMRAVVSTMLLAVVMLLFGLVFGRAWCGWLCPLGALLDWIAPRAPRKTELHSSWRNGKYVLLLAFFIAALLGNLTFAILDPVTIVNRALTSAFLPGLNVLLVGVERLAYAAGPLYAPFDWIEQNFRGNILSPRQNFYELGVMQALVIALLVALNWAVPRFWCRYLCPLGALYALEAKVAWLRPRALQECNHCADCIRVCSTGAINLTKSGLKIDPSECVLCLDCTTACPQSAIAFRFGRGPAAVQTSFDISRRQFVASAALGVAAVALFRSAPAARRDDAYLVRPPGALENGLLDKCIRCSECVKVCPTGGLQPSLLQSGWEGLWTPVLVPRIGYCDYSCNACGQICPTGAIPKLTLEDKRQQVIGVAYIDQNRCIPWAMYRPCIVCQEMCPVPDKAVKLDEVDVAAPDGTKVHLQRPRIQHDLCIGCGICEYQCPLVGPAAIRVYVPTRLPPLTAQRESVTSA